MKQSKRILSLLLCLCMVITLLPPLSPPARAIGEEEMIVYGTTGNDKDEDDDMEEIPASKVGVPIEPFRIFVKEGYYPPYTITKTSGPDWLYILPDGTVCGVPIKVGNNENLCFDMSDSGGHTLHFYLPVGKTTNPIGFVQGVTFTNYGLDTDVNWHPQDNLGLSYLGDSVDRLTYAKCADGGVYVEGDASDYNACFDMQTGTLTLNNLYSNAGISFAPYLQQTTDLYSDGHHEIGNAILYLKGENEINVTGAHNYGLGRCVAGIMGPAEGNLVITGDPGAKLRIWQNGGYDREETAYTAGVGITSFSVYDSDSHTSKMEFGKLKYGYSGPANDRITIVGDISVEIISCSYSSIFPEDTYAVRSYGDFSILGNANLTTENQFEATYNNHAATHTGVYGNSSNHAKMVIATTGDVRMRMNNQLSDRPDAYYCTDGIIPCLYTVGSLTTEHLAYGNVELFQEPFHRSGYNSSPYQVFQYKRDYYQHSRELSENDPCRYINTYRYTPFYPAAEIPQEITRIYNTLEQHIAGNLAYTLTGETKATHVGTYTATATLNDGWRWTDGTISDKTVTWKIEPRKVILTPKPASKVYGEADPRDFPFSYAPDLSDITDRHYGSASRAKEIRDRIRNELRQYDIYAFLERESGETAGSYPYSFIQPHAQSPAGSIYNWPEYIFDYTCVAGDLTANFTITKAPAPALAPIQIQHKKTAGVSSGIIFPETLTEGMPSDAGEITGVTSVDGNPGNVRWNSDGYYEYTLNFGAMEVGDRVVLNFRISSQNYEDVERTLYINVTPPTVYPFQVNQLDSDYNNLGLLPLLIVYYQNDYGQFVHKMDLKTFPNRSDVTDFQILYSGALRDGTPYPSSTQPPREAGSYLVTVSCLWGGSYFAGSDTFTIEPLELSEETADVTLGSSLTYTGEEQTQDVRVAAGTGRHKQGYLLNSMNLTLNRDYTVSGNVVTDAGDYTMTITGIGNFTGSLFVPFSVAPIAPTLDDLVEPDAEEFTMPYSPTPSALMAPIAADGVSGLGQMQVQYLQGDTYTDTPPTDAGEYTVRYFHPASKNYTEGTVPTTRKLIITQADRDNVTARVEARYGASVNFDLAPYLVPGASAGTPTTEDSDGILSAATVSGTTLTLTLKDDVSIVDKNAFVTVPITGGTNYRDYTVAVTIHSRNRTAQDSFGFAAPAVEKVYGDSAFTMAASGEVTSITGYASSNPAVATVSASGEVTIVGAGSTTITARAADSEEYLPASASYTLTVVPKPVTITGTTPDTKVYDGTTVAPLVRGGEGALSGVVAGDDVGVGSGVGAFSDKQVGEAKTVRFSGFTLIGAKRDSYVLTAQPADATASITPKPVTVTVRAASRPYQEGNTSVTLSPGAIQGAVSGDDLSIDLSAAVGTALSDAAGTQGVTVDGVRLTGADAGNYTLTAQPTDTTVVISKASWTLTATGAQG